MAFDTADNIINDAARELALTTTAAVDPFASTDSNILQMTVLLKGLGQDLVRDYAWTHLQKEHTFNTVASTASYALPTDFARILNQTQWNRAQVLPLIGPATPGQWQLLQARTATGVSRIFRIYNDLLYIFPTPSAAEAVYYEYISKYWVQPTGQSAPTTESCTAYTDTLYFDRRTLVLGLKYSFLRAKGFDSTAAQEDFVRALSRAQGADGAASILNIARQHGSGLIDGRNVPDTGYGS